jgi:hypothetical protein
MVEHLGVPGWIQRVHQVFRRHASACFTHAVAVAVVDYAAWDRRVSLNVVLRLCYFPVLLNIPA